MSKRKGRPVLVVESCERTGINSGQAFLQIVVSRIPR